MISIRRPIYFTVLFLLLCTPTNATDYYVNKNASGGNNGTSWTNAWESFGAINWNLIEPGDVVYISGGNDSTIYYEQLYIGNVQGTAANPITVIAGKYAPNPAGHSGRVIFDGMDYPASGSIQFPIYLGGSTGYITSYIHLKGFEIRGGQAGIKLEERGNCVIIDSMTIYHWYDLAGVIALGSGYSSSFDGVDSFIVRNCSIISDVNWGAQTDGIYIGGATNTIIHDNYVRMRSQHPTAHVDGIQSIYSQGFEIYNNVIISDSVYSPEGGGMPIILRSGDTGNHQPVIIYNNFLYMGGVWMDGANMGYVLNTHSGDQSLYPQSPTYIFNNTIIGNGPRLAGVALDYFGPNHKGVFLNNIVAQYGDGGSAGGGVWRASIGNGSGGAVDVDSIRNNLFYRQWADARFDGPWTNGQTTSSGFNWNYWTGTLGGSGIHSDPLLVNDIGNEPDQGTIRGDLYSNSPAINQGEDLTYLINYLYNTYGKIIEWKDIYGIPRDNTPTIGAYEYDAGPDLTPPIVTGATLLDSVTLRVNFSEALDETTAEDESNYSISNNISIFSASLSGSMVTLQTSAHSPGSYIVTVVNVEDLAGNPIAQSNTADYEYVIQLDVTPPELVGVQIVESHQVVLDFSEPLDESQASNIGNYIISEQIQVLSAELNPALTRICLTTDEHLMEHIYTIEINNLTDLAGNVISSQANSAFYKKLDIGATGYLEHLIENVDASATTDTNTSPQKTLDGLVNGDPDPNSRWAAEIMPQWIQFDLGAIEDINLIAISFYNWNNGRIYEYSIQISDDENNWNEIVSNASSSSQEWTFNDFSSAISARYVRIICESNNQANWAGLWEARIFVPSQVPVEIHSFTAEVNNENNVKLKWSTASETNNLRFDVERKTIGENFHTIGSVPGHGTTLEINHYNFIDNNVAEGEYIYRLKQYDFSGQFSYSNEVAITVSKLITFKLEQNYPNPFNPITTIDYSVPKRSFTKLSIFNAIGQEVALLIDKEIEIGTYKITFNAANLPSGIYFYRLQSGDFIETRKMVLMK